MLHITIKICKNISFIVSMILKTLMLVSYLNELGASFISEERIHPVNRRPIYNVSLWWIFGNIQTKLVLYVYFMSD